MTNDEIEDAFWNEGDESRAVREEPAPAPQPAYDLEEQLVGCGTSVGANYCEADDAVSKKEFRLRWGTCKKEARETKYFLRMVFRKNLAKRRMNPSPSSLVIRYSSCL